jgi:hypothetical protein
MKTKNSIIFSFCLLFISSFSLKSQVADLGNFMAGGVGDANELFKSYLSPYVNGFGASLTGGWYNTAKPHKLGGFDITVTFNTAIVPDDSRYFNVDDLNLQTFALATGADASTPTIAGPGEEGAQLVYNFPDVPEFEAFRLPEGINNKYVPSPMLQGGVGLIKGTEIMGRWMPTLNFGDNSLGMWGVGLKHSIKQWIPVLEKLPVLHLSVMGGYTKLNNSTAISVEPEDIGAPTGLYPGSWTFEDQSMEVDVNSFTANLLVSANLPVVCFYGGLGIANTKTNLKLLGYYPIVTADGANVSVDRELDPLDIEIKNQDGGVTKPRLNAGIRFKFAVVTLHFDYTYANYSVATAGLGISFR